MSTARSSQMDDDATDIIQGEPVTADTERWMSVGWRLVEESLLSSRDYSTLMIRYCFAAVPVYVALLKYFHGDVVWHNETAAFWHLLCYLLPVLLFLSSSVIFIAARRPKSTIFFLNSVENIQRVHQSAILRRGKMNDAGTVSFMAGVICGVLTLMWGGWSG